MRLVFGVILLFIFLTMFVGQVIQEEQKNNIDFDIYNYTENNILWNSSYGEKELNDNLEYENIQSVRLNNIITKTVDWGGYTLTEIGKWGVEFGYDNPDYDFEFFVNVIIYFLYATIIIGFFPVVVPIIALVYICIKVCFDIYSKLRAKYGKRK